MLEKLFFFWKGYLIIELCGESKERFLNLCKNSEIELLHIFYMKEHLYCKLCAKEYKKLYPFIKKTNCYPKIKKKVGIPFLLHHLKQRKGLIIGSILFILIVTQCSKRIWHIDVQGGFLHTRQQIMRVLNDELNIYGGILSELVDCFEIEKRIRLDYNEIGWISVEKKGCRLNIMLNESVMPNIREQTDKAVHIVAERDGIVQRVEVSVGVPQVKKGDIVQKGDVLISGIIPIVGDYDELIRYETVCAEGKVFLETQFSYEVNYNMEYEVKNIVDEKIGMTIFLFQQKLFSYIPRYSNSKYDIISIDIVPYVFQDYQVPIVLRKYRCREYVVEKVRMTDAQAKEKAMLYWEEFLKDWESQGVQIVKKQFETKIQRKTCKAIGTVIACGNFISYQEIIKEELNIKDEYSGNNP